MTPLQPRPKLAWLAWACCALPALARADDASRLGARLSCEHRPAPGRVVCEAELEVDGGELTWADGVVLEAPEFAPPLRSRIGLSAVVMKSPRRRRLRFALAATAQGTGRLRLEARAVYCPDDARRHCLPVAQEVETTVEVGPIRR